MVKGGTQDMPGRLVFPFVRTVKAKLLIAFCLIVGLNVAVGSIGWRGLSNTEQALYSLREQSLPDIGKALELAKRSSAIAAIAPFVGSIEVMNKLNAESHKLDEQLIEFRRLVDAVDPSDRPDSFGSLRNIAVRLEADLRDLIKNTRERLGIRSDMLELHYALDGRKQIERKVREKASVNTGDAGATDNSLAAFRGLVDTVLAAMGSESPMTLTGLEDDFAGFSEQLEDKPNSRADMAANATEIREFVSTQAGVFELRRRELLTLQKTQYLLASIHAHSMQLSDRVADVVSRTTEIAQARSAETNAAIKTGKDRILPLTLISVLAGVVAALYVLRNLAGNLQAVTAAMTRLASGDRMTNVPAVDRADELGSLARAFNVFKEQSFDRETLANDLVEKSRTLEATFANMTDGMSVFDLTGYLVAWNPQYVEINELNPAAVRQGMHFREIFNQLVASGVRAAFLDGSVAHPDELFGRRKTDAIRYEQIFPSGRVVELRSHPMPGGFATIYTDLTDRRAIERQLRQAQRMEAVGQLTSGMAHDFNNLLAAISGNLQMLHEVLHDHPESAPRILRALEAAERGATLTQRLLAFSRQQALQPEITDLNALILNLVDLLSYSLGNNIIIETDLQPTIDRVLVDPGQLENAVLNLIFNSRDAMPSGGRIRITTSIVPSTTHDGGNGFVHIRIQDNGVGMTTEVLAHVYEPFFTTKEKGRGSGLGLSMVYGFVTQSGGQIDIASEPGAGTTVSIAVPTARTSVAGQNRSAPESANKLVGGNERILIIEDDPIVRGTAVDMLTGLGYRTTVASDAEQAKAELDRSSFDLLFTDVILPGGMNGVDVAVYARTAQPGIAILYTSGYPRDRLNDIILTSESKLIGKPYRKDALATAIRKSLGSPQSNPKRSAV
jgi:signal transduction histidine kinase/HAMP domain-containing protein